MNKHTRLLSTLDDVFGMGAGNKFQSQFRKTGQVFDERTNEHVIFIEYRVRGTGDLRTTRRLARPEKKKLKETTLLQELIGRGW
jgi:hypothetical protein